MTKSTKIFAVIIAFFAITSVTLAGVSENLKKAEIKSSAFTFQQKLQLENLIWGINGIKDANYDLQRKVLTVKYDENRVTADMITYSIVTELGFSAEINEKTQNKNTSSIDFDKETKSHMQNEFKKEMNAAENNMYQKYYTGA